VSSVAESRGIQYSAEAAGEPGNLRCHAFCRWLTQERRAQYSIFVCNGTGADAQALAFILDTPDGIERTILQTFIGRCSDFSTSICLEATPDGLMPELRVRLTGRAGTYFTLVIPGLAADAPFEDRSAGNAWLALPTRSASLPSLPVIRSVSAPAAPFETALPPSRPQKPPAVIPMLLFFTALLAGIGSFIVRPQAGSLVLPTGAVAGDTVAVAYRATGLGAADYAVFGPDGQTIAHGPLALGVGSFALTVPQAPAAQAYLVRITVGNPLASASAQDYLRVQTPPSTPASTSRRPKGRTAPPPPQIRSLALDRATLTSGDALTVYYDVSATSGSIALYDPVSQIAYEKAAILASGHSTLVAPHVDGVRFLTVVATAQRGGATTQSRIAVTVTPMQTPAPFANAGEPDGDATIVGPSSVAAISAPATVRSGQPIRVDIRGAAAGLELSLIDGTGRERARRDLQTGQRSVEFSAPLVTKPTRFIFQATYPNGVGNETVVRAIVVTP
jgi:hypothetical protein